MKLSLLFAIQLPILWLWQLSNFSPQHRSLLDQLLKMVFIMILRLSVHLPLKIWKLLKLA